MCKRLPDPGYAGQKSILLSRSDVVLQALFKNPICALSVAMTATFVLIASDVRRQWQLIDGISVQALDLMACHSRAELPAMMFSTARMCVVRLRVNCMRFRPRSRTARCSLGRIVPVGRMPKRNR